MLEKGLKRASSPCTLDFAFSLLKQRAKREGSHWPTGTERRRCQSGFFNPRIGFKVAFTKNIGGFLFTIVILLLNLPVMCHFMWPKIRAKMHAETQLKSPQAAALMLRYVMVLAAAWTLSWDHIETEFSSVEERVCVCRRQTEGRMRRY